MTKIGDQVKCPTGYALGENFWASQVKGVTGKVVDKDTHAHDTWFVEWGGSLKLFHFGNELVTILSEPQFKVGDKIIYTRIDDQYIPSAMGVGSVLRIEGNRRDGAPVYQTHWPLPGKTLFFEETRLGLAPEPEPVPEPVKPVSKRSTVNSSTNYFLTDENRRLAFKAYHQVIDTLIDLDDHDRVEATMLVISELLDDVNSLRRGVQANAGVDTY